MANKRFNTILFLLVATVVNIILIGAIFLLFILIYGRVAQSFNLALNGSVVVFTLFILTSICTYIIYRKLVHYVAKRIDIEKNFEPIFRPRSHR